MQFFIYKDAKGEWRWRLQASNNKTVADSGEGYQNRLDCIHAISLIKSGAATATTWDISTKPATFVAT